MRYYLHHVQYLWKGRLEVVKGREHVEVQYVPAVHCNPVQTAAKRVMTAAYNSDINPIIFIVGQFHPSSTTLSEKIIQISALSSSWLGQFHPFSTTLSEKIIQLSALSSSWWGNFIPPLLHS